MKIKSLFINKRNILIKWSYVAFAFFVIGIVFGAFYCIKMGKTSDDDLRNYLVSFFENVSEHRSTFDVLKKSILDYITLLVVVFVCAFVRWGLIPIFLTLIFRGFIFGFSTASFIKYYGFKGLALNAISIPSSILFIPTLMLLCAGAVIISKTGFREDRSRLKMFIAFVVVSSVVFVLISVYEAYGSGALMCAISGEFY